MLYFPRFAIKDLEMCLSDSGGSDVGHATHLNQSLGQVCTCHSYGWFLRDISMPDIQAELTSPHLNPMLRKQWRVIHQGKWGAITERGSECTAGENISVHSVLHLLPSLVFRLAACELCSSSRRCQPQITHPALLGFSLHFLPPFPGQTHISLQTLH